MPATHSLRGQLPSYATLLRALETVSAALLPDAPGELAAMHNPEIFERTAFHSACLPAVPLHHYAHHLVTNAGYVEEGLAVGIALMARYAAVSGRGVTPLTMHRLFGTCVQVGMKATSDDYVSNHNVAPAAGMTLPELNQLERALLEALEYRVLPTLPELTNLPRALAALTSTTTRRKGARFVPQLFDIEDVFVAFAPPHVHSDASSDVDEAAEQDAMLNSDSSSDSSSDDDDDDADVSFDA